MIGLKTSYEIAYNGTENECRFELYADSADDLQGLTHFDGIKIQMGSECTDIATGDKYLLNGSGVWVLQPSSNAWQNVYTREEIDTMTTTIYNIMMYYHTSQESTDGTITFYTLGGNVGSLTIYGNGSQSGTPTPDNPIQPVFVGTLDGTNWTIPITCAGQTVPVYLGQVSTVRRVKKLVLTGNEAFTKNSGSATDYLYYASRGALLPSSVSKTPITCSHLQEVATAPTGGNTGISAANNFNAVYVNFGADVMNAQTRGNTVDGLKEYLASEYAAGNPVTVWYVLATPTTETENKPLAKIGDYSDELHLTNDDITIQTVSGENTLTVDTTLKPSKIEISGER